MNKAEQAKRTLVHYMQSIAEKAGVHMDSDCRAEIEGIVDNIIAAAVQAIKESERK